MEEQNWEEDEVDVKMIFPILSDMCMAFVFADVSSFLCNNIHLVQHHLKPELISSFHVFLCLSAAKETSKPFVQCCSFCFEIKCSCSASFTIDVLCYKIR